jgi:hypothetical protein
MYKLSKKRVKKLEPGHQYIVVNLNAKLQPLDRLDYFEDPLDEILRSKNIGEVAGGGSLLSESKEIESCDIEIEVNSSTDDVIAILKDTLEKLGAPKGSKLIIEEQDKEIPAGISEGLALYLNGTDLDHKVYQESDSQFVFDELNRLLHGKGRVLSHWQGPAETALYMYGFSFTEMKSLINEFVTTYPLCQKCRIEQIA